MAFSPQETQVLQTLSDGLEVVSSKIKKELPLTEEFVSTGESKELAQAAITALKSFAKISKSCSTFN